MVLDSTEELKKEATSPLVSVVMALNKDNPFLEQAISSILGQSYRDLEFIIVANRCEDDFFESLLRLSKQDMRIKLFRTDVSFLPFSLNLGVHLAKGQYIARMDGDDVSYSDRIERQVEYLNENEDIAIVGANVSLVDEFDNVIGSSEYPSNHTDIEELIYKQTPFAHPVVMYRKSAVEMTGGYMSGKYGEDYDLWIRMLCENSFKAANLPCILLNYRVHTGQATSFGNARSLFSYDVSIKVRQLLSTGKFRWVLGIGRTILEFFYRSLKARIKS